MNTIGRCKLEFRNNVIPFTPTHPTHLQRSGIAVHFSTTHKPFPQCEYNTLSQATVTVFFQWHLWEVFCLSLCWTWLFNQLEEFCLYKIRFTMKTLFQKDKIHSKFKTARYIIASKLKCLGFLLGTFSIHSTVLTFKPIAGAGLEYDSSKTDFEFITVWRQNVFKMALTFNVTEAMSIRTWVTFV